MKDDAACIMKDDAACIMMDDAACIMKDDAASIMEEIGNALLSTKNREGLILSRLYKAIHEKIKRRIFISRLIYHDYLINRVQQIL